MNYIQEHNSALQKMTTELDRINFIT